MFCEGSSGEKFYKDLYNRTGISIRKLGKNLVSTHSLGWGTSCGSSIGSFRSCLELPGGNFHGSFCRWWRCGQCIGASGHRHWKGASGKSIWGLKTNFSNGFPGLPHETRACNGLYKRCIDSDGEREQLY